MEFTVTTDGAGGWGVTTNPAAENSYGEIAGKWWAYDNGSNFVIINQTSTGNYSPRVNSGDVLQLAIDYSTGKVHLGINNTWINSTNGTDGNPATGANPTFTLSTTAPIFPIFASAALLAAANFGQRPFAYTAPSGFKSLCTANLPAPTIVPSTVMNVALYTGNSSTQTISGLGFSPDLVWVKNRSNSASHRLTDVIRGGGYSLFSNLTNAEVLNDANGYIASLNADGFTVSAGASDALGVNQSSNTYVGWCWDAGSSTVTNTQGSISSQVRANASAGFSIVSWNNPASAPFTVGHGLGIAPQFVIHKPRAVSSPWFTWHTGIPGTSWLDLSSTSAASSNSTVFSDAPTSSVLNLGSGNTVGNYGSAQIAYCFTSVPGYSSFGTTFLDASANGAFIYLGFRPRFVLLRGSDSTYNWIILDSSRDTFNFVDQELYPNLSNAENTAGSSNSVDFLSNGIKVRNQVLYGNFVYAAFAESPFAANNRAR
jgi:hypothetical protein